MNEPPPVFLWCGRRPHDDGKRRYDMKWGKKHLLLLAVIALLAAYLTVQKNGRTHYALPQLKPVSRKDITKLLIKHKDSTLTLARKDGAWVIEPQGYPADEGAVNVLLGEADGLTLTALASEGGNDAIYDLNGGKRIEVEAYEDGRLVRQFAIGKAASGDHAFIQLGGDKKVFHAEHDLRMVFDKNVADLRDRTVMKVNGAIDGIVLAHAGKTLMIARAAEAGADADKNGRGTGDESGAHWRIGKKPANDREVNELLDAVSHLSCDSFIEGKTKHDFHAPAYTVSLKGAKRYRLSIYAEQDKTFAAVSSESPYPFTLSAWRAKNIMKDFSTLAAATK
jgi:hypothetical protein